MSDRIYSNDGIPSGTVDTTFTGWTKYSTKEEAARVAQRRANILQDAFMVLEIAAGSYIVASKFHAGTKHVQTFRPE